MQASTGHLAKDLCDIARDDRARAWRRLTEPKFWLELLHAEPSKSPGRELQISMDGGHRPPGRALAASGLTSGAYEALRQRMSNDGHIGVPDFLDGATCEALAAAALALLARGWPPTFLLVFDEPWIIARALGHFMQRAVNGNLALRYEMFFYCVDSTLPAARSRGIAPHRDAPNAGFDRDGDLQLPRHCTGWLALTEATVENGTIYVVPPSREAGICLNEPIREEWGTPLEVAAGTLLAWSGHVAHWGGVHDARRAKGPRLTFTLVSSVEEMWGLPSLDLPTSATHELPSMEMRLERIHSLISGFEPARAGSPVATLFDIFWPRPSASGAAVTAAEVAL